MEAEAVVWGWGGGGVQEPEGTCRTKSDRNRSEFLQVHLAPLFVFVLLPFLQDGDAVLVLNRTSVHAPLCCPRPGAGS